MTEIIELEELRQHELWATSTPCVLAISRERIAEDYRAYLSAKTLLGGTPREDDQRMAHWLWRYDQGLMDTFFGEA